MDFCKNCGNMYYININEHDEVYNYCRNCGDKSELSKNELLLNYDTEDLSSIKIKSHVNQYTKYEIKK